MGKALVMKMNMTRKVSGAERNKATFCHVKWDNEKSETVLAC